MTSKGIRLSNEIKALYDYVNRDEYNLYVVEVMVNEIRNEIKRLKLPGETDGQVKCPCCGSKNVQCFSAKTLALTNGNKISCHYFCNDCHVNFDVDVEDVEVIDK